MRIDPALFRPTDVDTLCGNPEKPHPELGWRPKTSINQLIAEMVDHDLAEARSTAVLKSHGLRPPEHLGLLTFHSNNGHPLFVDEAPKQGQFNMRRANLLAISLILLSWVQPAAAYIDPGSGSAIMSALIGFVVASGLVIKTYWYKFKALFTGRKSNKNSTPDSLD